MVQATPVKLDVKKTQGIDITWSDGERSHHTLEELRGMCPCAHCREQRSRPAKKSRLTVLPGNYASPMTITQVELVGNYALRIEWSDRHDAGIYSFKYLRELAKLG